MISLPRVSWTTLLLLASLLLAACDDTGGAQGGRDALDSAPTAERRVPSRGAGAPLHLLTSAAAAPALGFAAGR